MSNFNSTTWLVEPSRGPRPFQPGDIVMDSWEIVRLLGEGGYGSVYEIRKNIYGVDSVSALKVIPIPKERGYVSALRSMGSTKAQIEEEIRNQVNRSVAEVQTMKRLIDHPAVVRCEDFSVVQYEDDDSWDIFIRMELLTPLADWLDSHPITEDKVREMGVTLAGLLQYCADEKILHRDIKPANIFMNRLGGCKLGDFGLARTLSAGTSTHSHGVGTDTFMAPEVAANQHYDTHADMYSLGLVLYWLLNKRRLPFMDQGLSFERSIVKRISGQPLPPIEGVEQGLMDAVLKACAFKPEDRFEDAAAMKQALSGAPTPKAGEPVASVKQETKNEEPAQEPDSTEPEHIFDPFTDYDYWADDEFSVGNTTEGVVLEVTDKGFLLQLAPNMETFVSIADYTDRPMTDLERYIDNGRVMDVEITEFDRDRKLVKVNAYEALKGFLQDLDDEDEKERDSASVPPPAPQPAPQPVPAPAPKPELKPVQESKPAPTPTLPPTPKPAAPSQPKPPSHPTHKASTISAASKSAPNKKKRLFWILFALAAVIIAVVSLVVTARNKDGKNNASAKATNASAPISLSVGDYVTFGRYPQTAAGTDKTPIEWQVLEVDEANNRALFISRFGIDKQPYNDDKSDITWENCSLRRWLNDAFLKTAFTNDEQKVILLTDIDNSQNQGYSGYSTNGGNNTKDKIFLLSYNEAFNLYSSNDEERLYALTDYAIAQSGAIRVDERPTCYWWWLRSPGIKQHMAICVKTDTNRHYNARSHSACAIHPALWIDLSTLTGEHIKKVSTSTPSASSSTDSALTSDTGTVDLAALIGTWKIVKVGRDNTNVEITYDVSYEYTILGLTIVVVCNRYSSLFRLKEESSAVLEFVSGTIVIPVILEWVMSYKQGKAQTLKEEHHVSRHENP